MLKTILFDFDGTIINTNDVIITSFQKTYEHFYGYTVPLDRITKFFGEPLVTTMKREFPMVSPEEAMAYYRDYQYNNAYKLIKEFPGIREMLKAIKDMGLKMMLVTSRTKSSTLEYLKIFNYEEYFMDIVSCDDTPIPKPNPEPIYMALDKLNEEKSDVIMVGDGMFDIKCANNADVRSVLVGWKITEDSNPLIGECKATYTVNTPEELLKLIKEL